MILIWLLIFPSLTLALEEETCLERHFIDKSKDSHPNPNVTCEHSEAKDRWRGELRFRILEDSTGIAIEPKHLVQRPECAEKLLFFVNNRKAATWQPRVHKCRNKDCSLELWLETEDTFDLKIQAFYLNTDQKCFQANRTIRLRELKIDNKMQDSKRADDLTPNETRKQTTMSLLNDQMIKSEPNKTTNQFHSDRRSKLNIFTISLSNAFVIFVIFSFSVAATVLQALTRVKKVNSRVEREI